VASDPGGVGVRETFYTTDGSTPTTSSQVYSQPVDVLSPTTVKFFSVDNAGNAEAVQSVHIQVGSDPQPPADTTAPTTTIACAGSPCSGWYLGSTQVSLAAQDDIGGSGVDQTYYTTDGSTPTTASTEYTGPFTLSSTSTVRFLSVDKAGNAEAVRSQDVQVDGAAPTTSIACNLNICSTGWYAGAVSVTLPASDTNGSGVAATYYTTDGSTPTTASTLYTGAFDLTQTRTVKYFSIDTAGNAEAVNSQLVQIDNAAPTTSIACNGSACSTSGYNAAVTVTLAATDPAGGSGVAATYYTTDGSTPTTSSTPYTGAFSITQTQTVRYFSADTAGNREAVKSQTVSLDAVAPSTTITCNGGACSIGWYTSSVTVTLAATDNSGGSGVSATYYTTDGSTPTTSSTRYTKALNITQTRTVKYFSVDAAGNRETVKSQLIQIDGTAPTTTIFCNNGNCQGSTYSSAVSVTLSATDNTAGSGVTSTHYTIDGTTPTLSSPTYTGPFMIGTTTTVKYRSWDVAGNVEAVKSRKISVVVRLLSSGSFGTRVA
jgi:hypothetical protein